MGEAPRPDPATPGDPGGPVGHPRRHAGTSRARLGASKSLIESRASFRIYRRLFGAEDMHSHYRWAAIAPLIDLDASHTLEVGGGDGRISFEVASAGHTGALTITELDPTTVAEARQIKAAAGFDQVHVSQQDLRQLALTHSYDQVLAIDVLEHIEDDRAALREIVAVMSPGARLVISVPTPNYPRVFGREFHQHLGHVRDGYWLHDIQALLEEAGLDVLTHRYYTGRAVSRAANLFYARGIPYQLGVLWAPLVRPFLLRSETNPRARVEASCRAEHAASLCLVATRPA